MNTTNKSLRGDGLTKIAGCIQKKKRGGRGRGGEAGEQHKIKQMEMAITQRASRVRSSP